MQPEGKHSSLLTTKPAPCRPLSTMDRARREAMGWERRLARRAPRALAGVRAQDAPVAGAEALFQ